MPYYVVMEFDDDACAKKFVTEQLESHDPHGQADTGVVIGVYRKPTKFCDCSGQFAARQGHGFIKGSTFGWWVHTKCGKPSAGWTNNLGSILFGSLGINMLPKNLRRHQHPKNWESKHAWHFLNDNQEIMSSGQQVVLTETEDR